MGLVLSASFRDLEVQDGEGRPLFAPPQPLGFTMPIGSNLDLEEPEVTRHILVQGPPDYIITITVSVAEALKPLRDAAGGQAPGDRALSRTSVCFMQEVVVSAGEALDTILAKNSSKSVEPIGKGHVTVTFDLTSASP